MITPKKSMDRLVTREEIIRWNNAAEKSLRHTGVYEPAFAKGTGYPVWTGTEWEWRDEEYLKTFTEEDPIFTASPAAGITDDQISDFHAPHSDDQDLSGLLADEHAPHSDDQDLTSLTSNMHAPHSDDQDLSGYSLTTHSHPWTPTLAVDHSVSGIVATFTAGENLVFGNVCYCKFSDGKMWKANGNAAVTVPGIVMATATISANSAGVFLIIGIARNDSWSFVDGLLWIDTTSGAITQTKPVTTDYTQQILGKPLTGQVIFFNPQLLYLTHI